MIFGSSYQLKQNYFDSSKKFKFKFKISHYNNYNNKDKGLKKSGSKFIPRNSYYFRVHNFYLILFLFNIFHFISTIEYFIISYKLFKNKIK